MVTRPPGVPAHAQITCPSTSASSSTSSGIVAPATACTAHMLGPATAAAPPMREPRSTEPSTYTSVTSASSANVRLWVTPGRLRRRKRSVRRRERKTPEERRSASSSSWAASMASSGIRAAPVWATVSGSTSGSR